MKMYNLDTLFLMPFHDVYLLDYLISCYERLYQWAVTKLGDNKSFPCHSPFMNVHELWNPR